MFTDLQKEIDAIHEEMGKVETKAAAANVAKPKSIGDIAQNALAKIGATLTAIGDAQVAKTAEKKSKKDSESRYFGLVEFNREIQSKLGNNSDAAKTAANTKTAADLLMDVKNGIGVLADMVTGGGAKPFLGAHEPTTEEIKASAARTVEELKSIGKGIGVMGDLLRRGVVARAG